ncbi:MAG: phytoene/squalene synthase family protein [Ignavibacteria bacterium]|nr:phytoene/squalene synthase family protein [Ignavibacteria bacterium]
MGIDNKKLKIAYQHCRYITKLYAKTFYFTSVFLPEQKRNSAYAVYAFCRYIDDLIDRSGSQEGFLTDKERIAEAIFIWKRDLKSVYSGDFIDNPIMIALKDTLSKYKIPEELPNELIEGVEMDLTKKRYDNFEELKKYCYKVASVVGLMTIEIFGYENKNALSFAVDMGIAMQLTNILRDIREDAEKNRIYIPREDLMRFDYDEENILKRKINSNFKELMKFQIDRANNYYDRAEKGIRMIYRDARLTVGLMGKNYRKILNEIQSSDYDVYNKRNFVPLYKKIFVVPNVYYNYCLKSS